MATVADDAALRCAWLPEDVVSKFTFVCTPSLDAPVSSPAAGDAPPAEPTGVPGEVSKEIVLVKYAGAHQLPPIMALMSGHLSEPYSVFTYRFFLDGWPELCFLAICDNQLIGAIIGKNEVKRERKRGYIAMLAVSPDFRKAGVGSRLTCAVLQAMSQTCDEIVLETELSNTAAIQLYENLGFIRAKRLPKYYLNGNDAYRFKLWLT